MKLPRLLYLGFAFPPGVSALFPELQPAGHLIETSLINSVRSNFDVRSVGVSGLAVEGLQVTTEASPGLPHRLNLLDKNPEVYHRYHSLMRLKRAYREWRKAGWTAEVIVVCNLSPVYNSFVRWLKRQRGPSPLLVLYLADSTTLGLEVPLRKRLRYKFKPLVYPEAEMLSYFDACVAVSKSTRSLFVPRKIPWLWLPNGIDPQRIRPAGEDLPEGAVRFGYFGALADHTGLPALLEVFTQRKRNAALDVCGYGKSKARVAEFCAQHPGLRFFPPRSPDECVTFARGCDVLVNARPICPGNDNNFSSKVFEYALSGRAILTTRLSGVDEVLGPEAFYFDEHDFKPGLDRMLDKISETPRAELHCRGAAIQTRMLQEYSWSRQGERFYNFLQGLLSQKSD